MVLPTEPAPYTNAEHAVDEWVKDEWSTLEELDAALDALIEAGTFDEQWWPPIFHVALDAAHRAVSAEMDDEPMFAMPQMEDVRTGRPAPDPLTRVRR